MTRRLWIPLLLLAVLSVRSPAAEDTSKEDLAALKASNVATDGKGLLAYVQKRTVSEATRTRVGELIRQMGAEDFTEREKASKSLLEIGPPARAQLRDALVDTDLEIKRRAKRVLEKLGTAAQDATLLPAAARALAKSKTPGACEAILNFLPSIEEPGTAEEVARALPPVATDKDGKPDPAILKALGDKLPLKRWAAGAALARVALKTNKDDVVKLLEDTSTTVRRQVALALVETREKAGVPGLIALLEDGKGEDVNQAEDMLALLAGEKAPAAPADRDDPRVRGRYRKQWESWWKDEGEKLDLAKVDFDGASRSYTLIGVYGIGVGVKARTQGKVIEVDSNGREKWSIDDLGNPVYACKVKRDRVLICEYNNSRVTERDTKGKIHWTKAVANPIYCEKLSNGHVFLVTRNQLLEVDSGGTTVKTINRNDFIISAGRHKDGTYSVITSNQQCIKLDKDGNQKGSFTVGAVSSIVGMRCTFLPNGGVIIPDYSRNRIREYDSGGKTLVDIEASRPITVSKLSNGNYLYCSRQSNTMIEVTKEGKEVSSTSPPGQARTLLFVERK